MHPMNRTSRADSLFCCALCVLLGPLRRCRRRRQTLGVRSAETPGRARRARSVLGAQPDRPVHPGAARAAAVCSTHPKPTGRRCLRRLSFDLTGLPPTPRGAATHSWPTARRDAYERLVDRLLASPHYGERWGQHWLDLARFAETDGFEFDQARPDAWRYRDWVVEALNRDLPYDQFVRLQLAGDEVRPDDPSAFIATGFNRCYPDMVDLNDQRLRRQNALDDITETTGLVFLGLTIGCARCHDHKFDPIPQTDYYRLQAFFAGRGSATIIPWPRDQKRHEYSLRSVRLGARAQRRAGGR